MKIAIPTCDGLTVSDDFTQARGFVILTLSTDKIVQEEIRWNDQSISHTPLERLLMGISDCNLIIINEFDTGLCDELIRAKKEVIKTKETIIINVFMEFVKDTLRKESNFCCCP
jgi:hypothetical protein